MIYRFRVILDVESDVFRDIEIESESNLEDFHNAIVQSFGFDGNEMASFYKSDEDWHQGEEYSLFDIGGEAPLMSETILETLIDDDQRHLLYIYDFFNMWTFFIELMEIGEYQSGVSYPNLLSSHGIVPNQAPEKQFQAEDFDEFENEFNDFEFDQDEFDEYHGYNQYDEY